MAMQIIWKVEESWKEQEMKLHSETTQGGSHQICSFMWADDCWNLSQSSWNLEQILEELVEEARRWDMQPEPGCLLWTSTNADEKSEDMIIRTAAGENRLLFLTKFRILAHCFNCEGKMQDRVEERMQCANKAWWRDVKIYRSKDVPWRVKQSDGHGMRGKQNCGTDDFDTRVRMEKYGVVEGYKSSERVDPRWSHKVEAHVAVSQSRLRVGPHCLGMVR